VEAAIPGEADVFEVNLGGNVALHWFSLSSLALVALWETGSQVYPYENSSTSIAIPDWLLCWQLRAGLSAVQITVLRRMGKVVTVIGATGNQGGSVVDALLKSGKYLVRAVTRNSTSAAAKALTARGVEVVEADTSDLPSLIKAFAGSYAVFGLTDFFLHLHLGSEGAQRTETEHGINISKAVTATESVQDYVYSTLPDTRRNGGGLYVTPQFQSKGAVDDYIRTDEKLLAKTTFFQMGFFYDNSTALTSRPSITRVLAKSRSS
jgi:hypothetical protein